MRVFLFEEDPSLRHMLTLYLQHQDHEVQAFAGHYSCPLYQREECSCPATSPCAEAVIMNTRAAGLKDSMATLLDQDAKGCKLPRPNKVVMSANITVDDEEQIRKLGFAVITKPFRLATVNEWLEECAERLNGA